MFEWSIVNFDGGIEEEKYFWNDLKILVFFCMLMGLGGRYYRLVVRLIYLTYYLL